MKRNNSFRIYISVLLGMLFLTNNGCKKDDAPIITATVTTSTVTNIAVTTASCGGEVTVDGGGSITERGICWGTSSNPTITGSKTSDGTGIGTFTSLITGLTANTTFFVRAYATNSAGTAYGSEISFKAFAAMDGDGNGYYSVIIGTQEWLTENLKTTKYNDGTNLPLVTGNTDWAALTSPACCWYNNDDASNKAKYGALYNFYALDPAVNGNKNIAPAGWHPATFEDWVAMRNYLNENGYNYDGSSSGYNIAKALCAVNDWTASGTTGAVGNTDYPLMRNKSGFTGLPGGLRQIDGGFQDINNSALWWTSYNVDSEQGWGPYIGSDATSMFEWYRDKALGLSVRCVKD